MPQHPKPFFDSVLRASRDGIKLAVRAQTAAKKTAITWIHGEGTAAHLKIAVHSSPIEGRANKEHIPVPAEKFSLPRSSIQLVSGELSRGKVFFSRDITIERAETILSFSALSS